MRKSGFTGASKSGEDQNAQDKKGYLGMLPVTAREVSRIVMAQKLTTVYLPLYPP